MHLKRQTLFPQECPWSRCHSRQRYTQHEHTFLSREFVLVLGEEA